MGILLSPFQKTYIFMLFSSFVLGQAADQPPRAWPKPPEPLQKASDLGTPAAVLLRSNLKLYSTLFYSNLFYLLLFVFVCFGFCFCLSFSYNWIFNTVSIWCL